MNTQKQLINKKINRIQKTNYKEIELLPKLCYEDKSLVLFGLTPKKDNGDNVAKYLLETYGYPNKNLRYKSFKIDTYVNKNNIIGNKYIIKLKLDYKNNILKLLILDIDLNIIDNSIYWNIDNIKNKVQSKLSHISCIIGEKYIENNKTFYKYSNSKIYKLKNFNTFLELLEQNTIFITFNIYYFRTGKRIGKTHNEGITFKILTNDIPKLFTIVDEI